MSHFQFESLFPQALAILALMHILVSQRQL